MKKIIIVTIIAAAVTVLVASYFSTRKPVIQDWLYFGNEAKDDLNQDGLEDRVYLVTRRGEAGEVYYYAIASLKTADGYIDTNTFYIGDRIAPQSTNIMADGREIHINYAERRANEPVTTPPSSGATLLLKVTKDGVLEGLMK